MHPDETGRHSYPSGYLGAPPSASTPTPAYPVSPPQQYGPQEYPTAQFAPPGFPPLRKKKSRTVELVAVAVIVLVAIGLGVAYAVVRNGSPAAKASPAVGQPANTPATCVHGRLGNGQCAAENGTTAAPTGPPPGFKLPLGASLGLQADDGQTDATITKVTTAQSGCKGSTLKSQHGTYLIADVKMSVTSGTGSVNPLFFEFVDSSGGTETVIGGMFAGCKDLGSGNNMPAGTVRTGQLVFDVADPHGEITFVSPGGGTPLGSWAV